MRIVFSEIELVPLIESQRPLAVLFYADWCPASQITKVHFENVECEFQGCIEFVKVPTDISSRLSAKAGIEAIPTAMFFAEGAQVGKLVGERGIEELRCLLNNFKQQLQPSHDSIAAMKMDRNAPRK